MGYDLRWWERNKVKEIECLPYYEGRGLQNKLARLEQIDIALDKAKVKECK